MRPIMKAHDCPVRECIVNGLIHRDYLELGSEVHIDMFDDRIEIFSPGGMMGGVPVQNVADIRKVGPKRRNPVVEDLFQRLELMERRGSGFGKILDAYIDASERIGCHVEPAFLSDSSDFVVTLPNLHYAVSRFTGMLPESGAKGGAKSGAKSGAKHGLGRSERNVRIIYRSIKGNPCISIGDLQRKTRLSNSGVRKIIAAMKAAGQLVRVGGPKGGHWEVIGKA